METTHTTSQSLNGSSNSIQEKKATLEQVRKQLKTEFFGLDKVIDQVMDLVSSWYCFPTLQEKPVIINLWGMTGTGKSSLVNRLVKLIGFENAHYRFDMGEISNARSKMNIYNQLSDTSYREPEEPFIISLDEFQHARSLDETGSEKVKPEDRIVWQILDDGTYEIDQADETVLSRIKMVTNMLREAIYKGVVTQDGYIVRNQSAWEKIVHTYFEFTYGAIFREDKEELLNEVQKDQPKLIPRTLLHIIYEFKKYSTDKLLQLEEDLTKMNTQQTLDFFVEVKKNAIQPTRIDCTRALIFVIGNLDEAYPMHQNSSPDIDADQLHRLTARIGNSHVKTALKERFRSEEIARLGNNHIIYPALRKQDFQAIISKELEHLKEQIKQKTNLQLQIDLSFEHLLYEEGVYPAQGSRPIFTTIYQLVYPLVTDVLFQNSGETGSIASVNIYFEAPCLKAAVYRKATNTPEANGQPEIISREQPDMLNARRKSRKDDFQAIIAVHEAGHAIGAIFHRKLLPEMICSVSADSSETGFIHVQEEDRFISRNELRNWLAYMLGGFAAETLIFGENHVTSGASNDIEKATNTLARMIRKHGLGPLPGYFLKSSPALNHSIKDKGELDQEIRQWIEEAHETINNTLKEQHTLLLKMAQYLADHPRMEQSLILDFCQKYGNGFNPTMLKEPRGNHYYRQKLMEEGG